MRNGWRIVPPPKGRGQRGGRKRVNRIECGRAEAKLPSLRSRSSLMSSFRLIVWTVRPPSAIDTVVVLTLAASLGTLQAAQVKLCVD